MDILDLIFPKKCVVCKKQGSLLCANCFTYISFNEQSICLICRKNTFNNLTHSNCLDKYTINGYFSAVSYNRTTEKLIHNFKNKPFLTNLQEVLSGLFYESIIQNENFFKLKEKSEWILVPVPLEPKEFRERGYNQAEILAKNLSKKLKIPMFNLLEKKDSLIVVKKGFNVKNVNIFIIDDVVKSGLTIKTAAGILKKSGARNILGLVLAKTNKKP